MDLYVFSHKKFISDISERSKVVDFFFSLCLVLKNKIYSLRCDANLIQFPSKDVVEHYNQSSQTSFFPSSIRTTKVS